MVRISVSWLPAWKWSSLAQWTLPACFRMRTAWISSGMVRPNLAKSPEEPSHLPVPRVVSLERSPIMGSTCISSASLSRVGSSESFSMTTMTLRPSLRPSSASRRNSSSLYPLQMVRASGSTFIPSTMSSSPLEPASSP